MQQPTGQTSKQYFSLLTILHGALLATQVIFAFVFYYVNSTGRLTSAEEANNLNEIFQFIVPALILAAYIGSSVFVNMQLKALKAKSTLADKLTGYRTVVLMRFAVLEFPSLFSIVCFVLTGNYLYLALAALIIFVFFINRPTPYKAVTDLELSPAERAVLENPDAVVV